MKKLFLFLILILTIGCGKKDDTPKSNNNSITIFTTWSDGDANTYDMSDGALNNQGTIILDIGQTGNTCRCALQVNGTEDFGILTIKKCQYNYALELFDYTTCSAYGIIDEYSYTRTSGSLELCSLSQNYCATLLH